MRRRPRPNSLLERSNVIVRDVESWEADFLAIQMERYQALSKRYPKELLDMWTLSDRVLEKGSGQSAGAETAPSAAAPATGARRGRTCTRGATRAAARSCPTFA
jgi:hypothetical protein